MNLRGIFTVFRKEFLENLRDRRTIITALIFGPLLGPMLFSGMMKFAMNRGEATQTDLVTIAVAHGERAPNLLRFLDSRGIETEAHDYDDAGARAAVRAKRHKAVLLHRQQIYSGGSVGGAALINEGEADVVMNWSGGMHHAKVVLYFRQLWVILCQLFINREGFVATLELFE